MWTIKVQWNLFLKSSLYTVVLLVCTYGMMLRLSFVSWPHFKTIMTTENVFDTGPCLFDHITCTKRYMNNMLELTLMSQDAHNQNKN